MVKMVNYDLLTAKALSECETLTGLLVHGKESVFHDDIPENNEYPFIVYTVVNESPALHADNKLYASEAVVRVTIVNNTAVGRQALKDAVYEAMQGDFMWQMTNTVKDGVEYYTSMDFSKGVRL